MTNTKMFRAFVAAGAAGGLALTASPASAAAATYSTDFSTNVTAINDGSGWRMSNPAYDAEITEGKLRISNAFTSGSFGDQLFSPGLAVGAEEDTAVNTFEAAFTLGPVALQPGLRVTISPDNGAGGRAGFLAIEHTKHGLTLMVSGSNGQGGAWPGKVVATKLDPMAEHTVEMRLVKVPDTKTDDTNDTFAVSVDGGASVTVNTFEAYYNATGEKYETDALLFRVSGTAVPALDGAGLVIDHLSMSTF